MSNRSLWLLLAVMLAVWAASYLPWLSDFDLQFEEPRRALIARAMLSSGEYLVPQLAGEVYTAKPPLYNWLLAASAVMHGELNEWSARFPGVLCVLLLGVLFVVGARRWLGPWAVAFFGLSLLLAPEILAKGRIAEIEPLFMLLVGVSLGSWFLLYDTGRRGLGLWLIPLLAVALAYLTKREPAVVFFYFAIGPFLLVRRQWRVLFEPGHFVAIAAAAGIVGAWLVSIAAETGWLALWNTLEEEVLQRGIAGQTFGDIAAHVLRYPIELFGSMLPFSLLLPLLASRSVRARVTARFGDLFVFCALAVLCNLPVYWFRGEVAVRYFLPMYPFVLLIAAMIFDVLVADFDSLTKGARRYARAAQWAVVATGLVIIVGLIVIYAFPSIVDNVPGLVPAPLLFTLIAACAASLWILARNSQRLPATALLLVFVTVVAIGRTFYFHVVVADRMTRYEDNRNASLIAENIVSALGSDGVAMASGIPWAIWYYMPDGSLRELSEDTEPAPGTWLLVNERELEHFAKHGFPDHEAARFVYRDDVLLLARAR